MSLKLKIKHFATNIPKKQECDIIDYNIKCYSECNNTDIYENFTRQTNTACILGKINENDFDMFILNTGANIYKCMDKTSITTTDVKNNHAGKPSWYGSLSTANGYIGNHKNTRAIHQFKTIRNLKLLDLLNTNNIKRIVTDLENKQIDDLKKFIDKHNHILKYKYININIYNHDNIVNDITKIIMNIYNIYAIKSEWHNLTQYFSRLIHQINSIKLATGYHTTLKIQSEEMSLPISKTDLNRYFIAETDIDDKINEYPILYKSNTTTYGHTLDSLNRVSTFKTDIEMTKLLVEHYNFDGYYGKQVPSLFHGVFLDEICIFCSRGTIERVTDGLFDWQNSNYNTNLLNQLSQIDQHLLIKTMENNLLYGINCSKITHLGGKNKVENVNDYWVHQANTEKSTVNFNTGVKSSIKMNANHQISNEKHDIELSPHLNPEQDTTQNSYNNNDSTENLTDKYEPTLFELENYFLREEKWNDVNFC